MPRHATASAMVVGPRGIILHKHKKFNAWIQPGGHIDPGESPWDSALREGIEETGLQLAHPNHTPLLFHISCHQAGEHFHLDSQYLFLGGNEDPSPPEGESQEIGWFDLESARVVADESMKDVLDNLVFTDLSVFGIE
ncbi:MAG: NUDIX domain-containing protein [Actinomycetota bacterium]|nr:NUDIX domain-containing protein [Actinomycetota bacterium]